MGLDCLFGCDVWGVMGQRHYETSTRINKGLKQRRYHQQNKRCTLYIYAYFAFGCVRRLRKSKNFYYAKSQTVQDLLCTRNSVLSGTLRQTVQQKIYASCASRFVRRSPSRYQHSLKIKISIQREKVFVQARAKVLVGEAAPLPPISPSETL